jgi:hypothetical protein
MHITSAVAQLDNTVNSGGGGDPGYEVSGNLYKSQGAAAIAWARQMAGNTAKNQNEYSSNIFSIKSSNGNTYYGFTPPLSFEGREDEGHNPYKESPGIDDPESNRYVPPGAVVTGNIHSHTGEAGWRDNNNFSPTTHAQKGDEAVMAAHQNIKFYLVTPYGNLINDAQGPNYPMAIGFPKSAKPGEKTGPVEIQWGQVAGEIRYRNYNDMAPAGTWKVIIPATTPQTDYTKPYQFPKQSKEKIWTITVTK